MLERIAALGDPWSHFLIWESDWHARLGITKLRQAPFVSWERFRTGRRVLSLEQICPEESNERQASFEEDVRFVTAAIRQSKEYYQAGLTVSELTRPTLMFYSALMLTQALTVALFGSPYLKRQKGHGLVTKLSEGTPASWPEILTWQARGDFVALYHATRWDGYWVSRQTSNPWPQFHILECLRSVGIVDSQKFLRGPYQLDHLLWSYDPAQTDILPGTVRHVTQTPVFEVPRIAVLFMIVFWLGVMARYHPVSWQQLLVGSDPEGYYCRQALEDVPAQFVQAMQEALPNPYAIANSAVPSSEAEHVKPQDLQREYRLAVQIDGPVPAGCEENPTR
jgi:hypothetical protein